MSPGKQSTLKPSMMFKIKAYLQDSIDGTLLEPVATEDSGQPTGNLSEIEILRIKEMKKKLAAKEKLSS